ncbi:MAG: YncE family protein, partial [Actinomycetota bacterium]
MSRRVSRVVAFTAIASLLVAEGASTAHAATEPLVWVALENDDQIALVNVRTGHVLRRVSTPGGPHNITVAADGTVVTALWGSDRIAIVGRHARFVTLGGAPHDVKISGRMIVVANQGAARIDRVRLSGDRLRSIPLRADPHDLAISPNGRRAWVTLDGTDDMAIVNLRTRHVSYFSTGVSPHDLLFAPDGRLWVTDWNGGLHVFRGRELIRTLHYGREAHHLAFTPDGEEAWTTDEAAGRAFVLTVRPVERIDSEPIPGAPHHVAVTANGRWVVVADHVRGTLVVFDADTHRRIAVIPVGDGPHGVWAVPAT